MATKIPVSGLESSATIETRQSQPSLNLMNRVPPPDTLVTERGRTKDGTGSIGSNSSESPISELPICELLSTIAPRTWFTSRSSSHTAQLTLRRNSRKLDNCEGCGSSCILIRIIPKRLRKNHGKPCIGAQARPPDRNPHCREPRQSQPRAHQPPRPSRGADQGRRQGRPGAVPCNGFCPRQERAEGHSARQHRLPLQEPSQRAAEGPDHGQSVTARSLLNFGRKQPGQTRLFVSMVAEVKHCHVERSPPTADGVERH